MRRDARRVIGDDEAENALRRYRALFKTIYGAEGRVKRFDLQELLDDLSAGRVQIAFVW